MGTRLPRCSSTASTNLLNEDTTSPYSFIWTNVGIGYYSLFARVIYGSGASVDSSAVNVTVTGNTPVSITVDAQANRHPISPLIYGVAFASSTSDLAGINFTMNRSGGNSETRYNWQLNAHNHAADWYFESIDDGSATPGGHGGRFCSQQQERRRAADADHPHDRLAAQTGVRSRQARQLFHQHIWPANRRRTGNGCLTPATASAPTQQPYSWLITTNDPNDASFPTNSLSNRPSCST